jgi:hypothetical protein
MAHTKLPRNISPRLRALMEPRLDPDPQKLDTISRVIADLREEAKEARKASGIEEIWLACEEAYVGIDAANRHEFGHNRWAKPMSPDGPLTRNITPPSDGRSNIFIPITARYVDAGTSKLTEILLPMDDKAFSFSESPLPDVIELKKSNKQVVSPELGVPLTRDARKGELPPPNPVAGPQPPSVPGGMPVPEVPAPAGGAPIPPAGAVAPPGAPPPGPAPAPGAPPMPGMEPPMPPQVPLTAKDLAEEQVQMAREKAKKAETRIYDWMVESCYTAEARKVIFDSCRLGVGVLKGPFPMSKRDIVANKTANGVEVIIRNKVFPGTRWVDAWNFFPDPACGENVHEGGHCFERDFFSEYQVRKLLDEPGYIAAEIEAVIEEGPGGIKSEEIDKPNKVSEEQRKNQYEIWYFHGVLSRDDYWCICHAAGQKTRSDTLAPQVFAIITMINDHVVKASFNPLDSGDLSYHAVPWRRRPGHWAGIGVAEQVSPAQRITNGAMRAMLNNAGKSAGTQIVVNRDAIQPADGLWRVTPDKIWELQSDANLTVDQAFGMFTVPNTTGPLNEIVQIGMRMAEESTNIPLVTQGQSGPTQPETLGGMQLQNNNANQLLRQVGSAYDDYITEPLVRQYYEYLLLDPDVSEDEKGDFAINAHGSAALVERSIQDQMLNQMLMVSKDPAYGLSPRKTMREFLKSKRFDPRLLENSEEEQAQIDQQPPPAPPQLEVAKIRQQTDAERIKLEARRISVEREDVLSDRTVALHELELKRELAVMEYAAMHRLSIEQVKAKLAETAMKLDVQQRMSVDKNGGGGGGRVRSSRVPQITSAPAEPAGTAPNGQAFEA